MNTNKLYGFAYKFFYLLSGISLGIIMIQFMFYFSSFDSFNDSIIFITYFGFLSIFSLLLGFIFYLEYAADSWGD